MSFHETAQIVVGKAAADAGLGAPVLEAPIPVTDPNTGRTTTKEADVVAGGYVWEVKPEVAGEPGKPTTNPKKQLNTYTKAAGLKLGPRLPSVTDIRISPEISVSGTTLVPGVTMHVNFRDPGVATYGFDLTRGQATIPNVGTMSALGALMSGLALLAVPAIMGMAGGIVGAPVPAFVP